MGLQEINLIVSPKDCRFVHGLIICKVKRKNKDFVLHVCKNTVFEKHRYSRPSVHVIPRPLAEANLWTEGLGMTCFSKKALPLRQI
jgi:hypothetical protein